jgi:wnt family
VLGSGHGDSHQSDWPGAARVAQPMRGSGHSRKGSLQARSPIDRVEAMLANKSVRDEDLVYYTISPDYCLPDPALGSVGTKDR